MLRIPLEALLPKEILQNRLMWEVRETTTTSGGESHRLQAISYQVTQKLR